MKKLVQFLNRYAFPLLAMFMYMLGTGLMFLSAVYEKKSVGLAVFTAVFATAGLLLFYKMFWRALRTLHQNQNN